jgi:hypothetical protein
LSAVDFFVSFGNHCKVYILHGAWSLIHLIFIISLIFATVPHKDISLGSASKGLWHLPERRNMVDDDVLYEDFTFQAPCPL